MEVAQQIQTIPILARFQHKDNKLTHTKINSQATSLCHRNSVRLETSLITTEVEGSIRIRLILDKVMTTRMILNLIGNRTPYKKDLLDPKSKRKSSERLFQIDSIIEHSSSYYLTLLL